MGKIKNIQLEVVELINSDTDFDHNENESIIDTYNSCNKETKSKIDDIFISLTGYSLKTIIKGEYNE